MVVAFRIRYAKAQRHGGEKGRLRQHGALRIEIIRDLKHQLIGAGCQSAGHQRRVGAAIMIGAGFQQQGAGLAMERIKRQRHIGGGFARGCIQDVG
eukprot:gene7671-7735_t